MNWAKFKSLLLTGVKVTALLAIGTSALAADADNSQPTYKGPKKRIAVMDMTG